MPLPWLIGAAVVAAATAVAKAVYDDDSASSNSGEEERLEQEREAKRQHELERLETQLVNLKKNRLERAHGLLVSSASALGKPLEITVQLESEHSRFSGLGVAGPAIGVGIMGRQLETKNKLTLKKLDSALISKEIATSEYAQAMDSALRAGESSQSTYSSEVLTKFLTNLRVIESLCLDESPVSASADASPLVLQRKILGFPSAPADKSPKIVLSSIEREDFEKIYAASTRLEHLHHLKKQLELQE